MIEATVADFAAVAFFIPIFAPAGRNKANRRGRDPRHQSIAEKGHTMKRDFLQNLKVGEEPLPKEVIDAIMDENGRDITKAKADAVKPYADYQTIKDEYQRLKDQQSFSGLKKNMLMTMASMVAVAACISILSFSYCVGSNLQYMLDQMEDSIGISVFLKGELTGEEIEKMKTENKFGMTFILSV